jgi:hypothetical protein
MRFYSDQGSNRRIVPCDDPAPVDADISVGSPPVLVPRLLSVGGFGAVLALVVVFGDVERRGLIRVPPRVTVR